MNIKLKELREKQFARIPEGFLAALRSARNDGRGWRCEKEEGGEGDYHSLTLGESMLSSPIVPKPACRTGGLFFDN
jgi:hypothetical protein